MLHNSPYDGTVAKDIAGIVFKCATAFALGCTKHLTKKSTLAIATQLLATYWRSRVF